MKRWERIAIIVAASLFVQLVAKIALTFVSTEMQIRLLPPIFYFIGVGTIALWFYLFMHTPKVKTAVADVTEQEAVEGTDKLPSNDEEAVVEHIARAVAAIYDNDVNDHYREAAQAVAPSIIYEVGSIIHTSEVNRQKSRDRDYLKKLENSRDTLFDDYTKKVNENYPALASATWDGLERVNKELEAQRKKLRSGNDRK